MSGRLIDELRELLGDTAVLTGDDAAPSLLDARKAFTAHALAVVRPADRDGVTAAMRWSAERGVVVVPLGGNTGLSGGTAVADARPTIMLSLERLRAIEHVDPDGWTMTVEAGVTIEAMQQAAAAAGRRFGPDWGARGTATIGGAIATNAGGNNVVRYGNLREQVLGVEVVLADGTVWDGLRSLRKDASGYDLKHLVIGSEGTLGIVTRAVVRLHPVTPHEQSALASLRSLDALMELFALVRSHAGDALVAFELMPTDPIRMAVDKFDLVDPLDPPNEFVVLVKLAGAEPVEDRLAGVLAEATRAGLVDDAVVAATPEQEANLWTIRDEINARSLFPLQHHGLKLDDSVPIQRIAELYRGVEAIAQELAPEAYAYGFGHVGDGNLHVAVVPVDEADVESFLVARPELVSQLDGLVLSLGGSLSAEHGIGRDLVDRIGPQKPDIEWQLMRTIKNALDPDHRLNPGAVLPTSGELR